MKKTRKVTHRHTTRSTRKVTRKSQLTTIVIHRWVIFGALCLVGGFMLSNTMQSGAAKGGNKPTPTLAVSPTPTPEFPKNTITPNPTCVAAGLPEEECYGLGNPKPSCDPSGEWCTGGGAGR